MKNTQILDFLYPVYVIVQFLIIILPLLIATAYFTLVERKVLATFQRRIGPNVIGFFGSLQPLADGLKLLTKEVIVPSNSNKFLFTLAPIISFTLSLIGWSIVPYNVQIYSGTITISALFVTCLSLIGVYGILIAGWASNSKYGFVGALRSTAQMISYELPIGFMFLTIFVICGSLEFTTIVLLQRKIWYCFGLLPLVGLFFITALAETNRHPFDLPEAETELVAGFNVEFSGMCFAMFSLAEYINMLFMSFLETLFFFGGSLSFTYTCVLSASAFFLGFKICVCVYLFILARALLPRYKYNELMSLSWVFFLPISFSMLILSYQLIFYFNWFPK